MGGGQYNRNEKKIKKFGYGENTKDGIKIFKVFIRFFEIYIQIISKYLKYLFLNKIIIKNLMFSKKYLTKIIKS